ncbi:MAG: hypothetical protein R6U98_29355 [Pirellulaceae bacterium]
MVDEHEVDTSCMESLANAVESLLLASQVSKGLDGAFISITPLRESDFPTAELRALFSEIAEKHAEIVWKFNESPDGRNPPRSALLSHVRYANANGRTKHWFKRQIWTLCRGCLHHNLTLGVR